MEYDEFKKEIVEVIDLFPKGHVFCLREIFGTRKWNKLKDEKLNYGNQFFSDFKNGMFPTIKDGGKSNQGEQLYIKC